MIKTYGRRLIPARPAALVTTLAAVLATTMTLVAPWAPAGPPPAASAPSSQRPADASAALSSPSAGTWPATGEAARLDDEIDRTRQVGPALVTLGDAAVLHLPPGEFFVPRPAADQVLRAMGQPAEPGLIGVVHALDGAQSQVIVIRRVAAASMPVADTAALPAIDLVQRLRGHAPDARPPGWHIGGWAEQPAYDAARQRVGWATRALRPGDGAAGVLSYNAYVLGRAGYVSLNLLTDGEPSPDDSLRVRSLAERVAFEPG